jgi:hypothetical protein
LRRIAAQKHLTEVFLLAHPKQARYQLRYTPKNE